MSSSQSLLLAPTLSPPPLPRLVLQPPTSVLRLPRLAAKLSHPPLAISPPGGFGDGSIEGGCGGGGGGGGGGGWWRQGGRGPPDPGDGWWRRWLQSLHPGLLILFVLLQSDAFASIPAALAEAIGASVWEVRGGARTLLVPDLTGTSYVVAGDGRAKQAEEDGEKAGAGRAELSALWRQLERSWRRCSAVAVQLLLPDGYPHSVSSDYLQYSLWRGVQGIASQISGVLSTQALLYAVGVGKGAIPTAAAVNWVLKDGLGYLSKILLSKFGRHFDVNPKGWRLFADLLENTAYGLEILTPVFPQLFVPIGAAAGAGRSAAALIQAATRSCFYAGFAVQRNFAEVIAKGEAQGMVSKFLGIMNKDHFFGSYKRIRDQDWLPELCLRQLPEAVADVRVRLSFYAGTRQHGMWGLLRRRSPSGFSPSSTAEEVTAGIDGSGLVAVVTGASSGIGAETCRVLVMRGVHVVMGVRNSSAGARVRDEILKQVPAAKIEILDLDLSSMSSVRRFTENFNALNHSLNILINNAGIAFVPFKLSEDGIELHFATNHLGHFLLTELLIEKMKVTAIESGIEGRVVIVASESYRFPYREGIRFDKINDESGFLAYTQSKLANILHSNLLSSHLQEQDAKVIVNSLHPGAVATSILHQWGFLYGAFLAVGTFFVKGVEQGAATVCYVALHPQVAGVTGKYFADCNITELKSHALDMDLAKRLPEAVPTHAMWGLLRRRSSSGFSPSSTAEEVTAGIDGSGLVAVVTGASSGIGAETCRVLAMRGVHVVMGVRNSSAGARVRDEIVKQVPAAKIEVLDLDLNSMASVRRFAENFNALNLINNAGIAFVPFKLSEDAIEMYFSTNHLGHFLLTDLLLENMEVIAIESGIEGRVVIVASDSYKHPYREGIRFDKINDESGYNKFLAYGQSKLANILHSNLLSSNLKEQDAKVTVNSLHPGAVATNIMRHWDFVNGILSTVGKFVVKGVEQ
ncbi:hypothetical protein E2562_003803, partial [Oryza meyeriana var. granulata]